MMKEKLTFVVNNGRTNVSLAEVRVLVVVVIAGATEWYLGYFGAMPADLSVTPTYQDVAYTPTAGTQKLNLYLPAGDGPFPVVVNIHGGGFKFGNRSMVNAILGQALLDHGYAIASVDYRLSGEATFPAAVRFLRGNATQYKLNSDQIVAFGFSAGGNLTSMLGMTGDVPEFDDPALGNEGVSSRVQAVIDWFGPTDVGQMDEQAKAQGDSGSTPVFESVENVQVVLAFLDAKVK